jgi:hypothetical protein
MSKKHRRLLRQSRLQRNFVRSVRGKYRDALPSSVVFLAEKRLSGDCW